MLRRFSQLFSLLVPSVLLAQGFNSGTVTSLSSQQSAPVVTSQNWRVVSGTGAIQFPVLDANGNSSAQITITTSPTGAGFTVEYALPTLVDLRPFDTVSFPIQTSHTHIGDYMYFVDSTGRLRWYHLILRSEYGIQQPVYSINNFVGEHDGFDISHVSAIRYGQYGMVEGDTLTIGTPIFEVGLIDHCNVSSSWYLDIASSGTITTSQDSIDRSGSILANFTADNNGQADIAILGTATGILWDLSRKKYISFYFKDMNTSVIHYFLIYDKNRNYREWLFTNSDPGNWIKVTGDLSDSSYFESGPVDLSNIQQFEVGVFNGPPHATYILQVDEVTAK